MLVRQARYSAVELTADTNKERVPGGTQRFTYRTQSPLHRELSPPEEPLKRAQTNGKDPSEV